MLDGLYEHSSDITARNAQQTSEDCYIPRVHSPRAFKCHLYLLPSFQRQVPATASNISLQRHNFEYGGALCVTKRELHDYVGTAETRNKI